MKSKLHPWKTFTSAPWEGNPFDGFRAEFHGSTMKVEKVQPTHGLIGYMGTVIREGQPSQTTDHLRSPLAALKATERLALDMEENA